MTPDKTSVETLIQQVLSGLREDLKLKPLDGINASTPIYGSGSDMDSMALIHFVADLEAVLEETYKLNWILADERAMSRLNSPYRTVGDLVDFVIETTPGRK